VVAPGGIGGGGGDGGGGDGARHGSVGGGAATSVPASAADHPPIDQPPVDHPLMDHPPADETGRAKSKTPVLRRIFKGTLRRLKGGKRRSKVVDPAQTEAEFKAAAEAERGPVAGEQGGGASAEGSGPTVPTPPPPAPRAQRAKRSRADESQL
jgi:hypothetical protein